jgi:dipeptidyl aminopeptidase/acylaminoacyl peptidase
VRWPPLLLALLWLSSAPASARLLEPGDIHRIADISDPVVSPDGRTVVYVLGSSNLKADAKASDLWLVPHAGGMPRNISRTTAASEWQPRFSADGRSVYFLSDAGGDAQLWRQPFAGGRARQLSRIKGGVRDYDIAADGRVILVAEVGKHVGAPANRPYPVHVTRLFFKQDGRDYLDDRRLHLFLLPARGGEVTQISSGDFDHYMPAWSPDGRWIAFVSKRDADADRALNFDVFIMEPKPGATPRKMSNFAGADNDPEWESPLAWSPDSRRLAWIQGGEDKWIYYTPVAPVVADIVSGVAARVGPPDRWIYSPHFSTDGQSLLARVEEDRVTRLASIQLGNGKVDYLTGSDATVEGFEQVGDSLVVLQSSHDWPTRLLVPGAAPRLLANHNEWLADVTLARASDISAKSGDVAINGFVLTPPATVSSAPHPAILRIHGGPVSQYERRFMFDWQLYAAKGYAVLAANPRGSSGRGFDFSRAIYADWGNLDVKDVLAVVDAAVANGIADPARLGVGGWSYGGILTNYVIASDTRFKAAVSGAGVSNIIGLYGVDQYIREYQQELGAPWSNPEVYAKLSYPFFKADRITTPTLFQCALADFNVPCAGAEQMYQIMRMLGRRSELVLYPGENHGLSRPSFIEDRLVRNLGWYDRFVRGQ